MKLTRAFICVEFSDGVIREVARVQELLDKKFIGKFTELENLHLTLKFLGEIDEDRIVEVKKRLGEIKLKEFEGKLHSLGTFSHKGNPRIIWIKITGREMVELQKQIDIALKDLFKSEERFMSHLTIARVKHVSDKKYFFECLKNIHVKKVKFKISSFKLKSSELRRLGPVYEMIDEYKFD